MMLFRLYDPAHCGDDGYPLEWHDAVKHEVRELAEHRCVRCGHPYLKGAGQWSECDDGCTHGGPLRLIGIDGEVWRDEYASPGPPPRYIEPGFTVEAAWRILTVHHLNGVKWDCRWHNLVSLCQRCHLTIQLKVHMDRRWLHEHSDWFKPYAAGYYAAVYLGEELTRDETVARMDELLALEHRQESLVL